MSVSSIEIAKISLPRGVALTLRDTPGKNVKHFHEPLRLADYQVVVKNVLFRFRKDFALIYGFIGAN